MTSSEVVIAVDAMGGDNGPSAIVSSVCNYLTQHPSLRILLVGQRDILSPLLSSDFDLSRIEIIQADAIIGMDEQPARVLRRKHDSSMAVALTLVANGQAHACVSTGNTGALMLLSRSILGMLPGIERPALAKAIPSPFGRSYVLDLGANIDCTADHLYQFAVMGAILAECSLSCDRPRVALLNVGGESNKGNEVVKVAAMQLKENKKLNYIGFIEGDEIFVNRADVVVCDGFVGNIALKTGEGVAVMLKALLQQSFQGSWYRRLVGILVSPLLDRVFRQMHPAHYNGAQLLGVDGVVVKAHGNSDAYGFSRALNLAVAEVENNLLKVINSRLDEVL